MKKIFIAVLFTLILAVNAYAIIEDAVSYTLNTSTYVQVKVPTSYANQACTHVMMWTGDDSGFYVASDSDGTGVRYFPDGMKQSRCVKVDSDGTVLWVKGTTTGTFYLDLGR